tara:strand:+ start:893 stop:1528 length:636 start_codon:yes stop_codon:yes gene_type:complete
MSINNDQYFNFFCPPPVGITHWDGDCEYIETKIKEGMFKKSQSNSLSLDRNILDNPTFIDLKKFIHSFIQRYTEKVFRTNQKIKLLQSWANIENNGDCHPVHFHPNSYMSGVMFVKSSFDSPPLILENPFRPYQLSVDLFNGVGYDFPPNELTNFSMKMTEIKPIPGNVVIFPSLTPHRVPQSHGGERMTIAFNSYPELPFGSEEGVTQVY